MKIKTFKVEVQVFDHTDARQLQNLLEYAFDEAGIDCICSVEEVAEKKASIDESLAEAEGRARGTVGNSMEQKLGLE